MNLKIHPLNNSQHRIKFELTDELSISLRLGLCEIEDLECELTNIICRLAKYRKEQQDALL